MILVSDHTMFMVCDSTIIFEVERIADSFVQSERCSVGAIGISLGLVLPVITISIDGNNLIFPGLCPGRVWVPENIIQADPVFSKELSDIRHH